MRPVLPIAVLLALATGCSSAEEPPAARPSRDGAPPPAASGSAPSGPQVLASVDVDTRFKARLEVVGLNRHGGDDHILVQLRVTNNDTRRFDPLDHLADDTDATPETNRAGGIFLLDTAARRVVKPLQTADDCLCSVGEKATGSFLGPGEQKTFFAVLPAPSGGARTATLLTPMSPPLVDVPISDAPAEGDFPAPVGETVSYPLDAHAEDDRSELRDDGEKVEVSLSADVLFATGSHALTPAADALIEKTAARISGGTVKVEGHADSTGDAKINDPLSRRRAEAVAERLKSLLPDASFETKGFGATVPLYPNTTEEGRRRNRRVTITYTRTEQSEPRPSATPPAAPPAAAGDFTLTVNPLRPVGGGLSLLTYALTNSSQKQVSLRRLTDTTERTWLRFRFWAAVNVELLDGDRRIPPARYILDSRSRGWDQLCLCTKTSGIALGADRFAPAQTKTFWALVQTPSGPATAEIADLPAVPVPN